MSEQERDAVGDTPAEQEENVQPEAPAAPATAQPADEGAEAVALVPSAEAVAALPAVEAAPAPIAERPRAEAGERRRRPFGRRKVCSFCVEKAKEIDYKDAMKLRRYLSDRGRIESRRKTGTCAKHQRWLAVALKRARHLALLPYSPEHIRASGAPIGRR